jgi:mannose/cellobiose epimerase-like protein (N-acyl-D-glucosamine 2-epimerase family)
MRQSFYAEARQRYQEANTAALRWLVDRPVPPSGFLDTKMHSITLRDYGLADGWRGPDFTYGWIQGRGLEALTTFADELSGRDSELARALTERAHVLYGALEALLARTGHVYFCHDRQLRPVYPGSGETAAPQDTHADIHTYSDAFAAKGLLAFAARHRPQDAGRHLDHLARTIDAIEQGRFQIDERRLLCQEALACQPDDLGPRMILLGAASLVAAATGRHNTGYAIGFIEHVLSQHLDGPTSLLRNVPGGDACNVGHGIEFVGFVLDHLRSDIDPDLLRTLERILEASFAAGFRGPGLVLSVSVGTGAVLAPHCPWWSLPETIRAAALLHRLTGSDASLAIWRQADAAFFGRYWRGNPPIAYQTMTADGPVDVIPATPDLDPCYHTGLSLLAASRAAAELAIAWHPRAGS